MARQSESGSSVLSNLVKGALAGAAGIAALDLVTELFTSGQKERSLEKEAHARPKAMDPAHVAANRVAAMAGYDLDPSQPHPAGKVFHFAFGVIPSAVYAATRPREGLHLGRGLLFGLASHLLQDQGMSYALGISGPPTEYPWEAHVRGLVGHLTFGAVSEGALASLDWAQQRLSEPSEGPERQIGEESDEPDERRPQSHAERNPEQRVSQ